MSTPLKGGSIMSEQNKIDSWEAATVDGSVVRRINEYEQGFREERAKAKAKRESRAGTVSYTKVTDVSNPSRAYEGKKRPQHKQPEAAPEAVNKVSNAPKADQNVNKNARLQEIRGQLGASPERETKSKGSGDRLNEIKQQLSHGNERER